MIAAVSSPAAGELVQLDKLKERLQLGDEFDSQLEDIREEVEGAFVRQVGYPLRRQAWRETLDGHGHPVLSLSRLPVEPGSLTIGIAEESVDDWRLESDTSGLVLRLGGGVWERGAEVVAEYMAGWLPPAAVSPWAGETVYEEGAWVSHSDTPLLLQVKTAGTSGAEAPEWPKEPGSEILDGGVTWAITGARTYPTALQGLELAEIRQQWLTRHERTDLASIRQGEFSESYRPPAAGSGLLSSRASAALRQWRHGA